MSFRVEQAGGRLAVVCLACGGELLWLLGGSAVETCEHFLAGGLQFEVAVGLEAAEAVPGGFEFRRGEF
jgi:hypothetical protein